MMHALKWLKFLWQRVQGRFPDWKRLGRFVGTVSIDWRGPRNYFFHYRPDAPFRFERGTDPDRFVPAWSNGRPEIITPGDMLTDGGSIPRIAWFTGLDPWIYLPAYLIHDWEFDLHHSGQSDKSLEEVNLTLLEAVYTLQQEMLAPRNDFHLRLIYDGVSSPIGTEVWNGSWQK